MKWEFDDVIIGIVIIIFVSVTLYGVFKIGYEVGRQSIVLNPKGEHK